MNVTFRHFMIDGLHVNIYADKESLGAAAASLVASSINQAIRERGTARVIFATGASQYEFLAALIHNETVDWSRVIAFHLDEYIGLPADHPASFRAYLRKRLFEQVPVGTFHLLNGNADDPEAECQRYAALLTEQPIDVACVGIGENGHLAFNDPPADFHTPKAVHIVTLDGACRRQQVGEGHFTRLDDVPVQALSLTIPAILKAKTISCAVPDSRKAAAVRATLEGQITPMCPASALRKHSDCTIFLDTASADGLTIQ